MTMRSGGGAPLCERHRASNALPRSSQRIIGAEPWPVTASEWFAPLFSGRPERLDARIREDSRHAFVTLETRGDTLIDEHRIQAFRRVELDDAEFRIDILRPERVLRDHTRQRRVLRIQMQSHH